MTFWETEADKFTQYVGLPYVPRAQGPKAYDCMGLFTTVQGLHFGIKVPAIFADDYDDERAIVEAFKNDEFGHWRNVENPRHGDAVKIRRPLHIGVWLDIDGGGVLHAVRGSGVLWTRAANWKFSGFGRREYWRHESKLERE